MCCTPSLMARRCALLSSSCVRVRARVRVKVRVRVRV